MFSGFREEAITRMKRTTFLPFKLGIEKMNKVPGKIKISYLLVEIFERPLNIPKRPSIENIGILNNYGTGVRGTNAHRLPSRTFVRTSLMTRACAPTVSEKFDLH